MTRSSADCHGEVLEIEDVLAKGLSADGTILYQVRWRNFGPEDDTWEPEQNLGSAAALIAAFERTAILEMPGDEQLEHPPAAATAIKGLTILQRGATTHSVSRVPRRQTTTTSSSTGAFPDNP